MQGLMIGAKLIHSHNTMHASDVMVLHTYRQPSGADLQYMEDLLSKIEAAKIPAPSPIEQRWTCGSSSIMSPASAAAEAGDSQDHLFSWVGIIMYLPTDDERQRAAITKRYAHAEIQSQRLVLGMLVNCMPIVLQAAVRHRHYCCCACACCLWLRFVHVL